MNFIKRKSNLSFQLIEDFYVDNREVLLKRLYHRAGTPENAEDVLQESFERALKYMSSFDAERQELGAWFNTIMNNTLKTFKRDERSCGTYVEFDEELADPIPMSQTNEDTIVRIKETINSKQGDDRTILHLYFNEQYKPREIMTILDTNNKRINYVVNLFKLEMSHLFEEEE